MVSTLKRLHNCLLNQVAYAQSKRLALILRQGLERTENEFQ